MNKVQMCFNLLMFIGGVLLLLVDLKVKTYRWKRRLIVLGSVFWVVGMLGVLLAWAIIG